MNFSLIICGYNESDRLNKCIQSCLEQDYPKDDYEILYIDNNSRDNSLNIAKKYPIKVFCESRQGLSEARNCGIRNSVGDILIFLDADLELEKFYLKCQAMTFENKSVGAGGGMVLPLVVNWISQYLGVSLFESYPRYLKDRYVTTYPGCNLSIRRSVLKQTGEFIENFENGAKQIPRSEDKEMCQRIRKLGYLIMYNSHARLRHLNRYKFSDLFFVWIKGAKSRNFLIKQGKTDPFSLLFKYNFPLSFLALFIILLFAFPLYAFAVIFIYCVCIFSLSIKSYLDTKLFLECFFIKPWMDTLSLLVINLSTLLYSIKNRENSIS